MSDATLRFLPWLRRGLAGAVARPAVDGLPTGAAPPVTVSVEIAGGRAERQVRLRGPGSVVGLVARQVLREDPKPGTHDFEPNYFPCVELLTPELPWMYSPAAPGSDHKLVPWLVLVVVEKREGVAIGAKPGAKAEVLSIASPADAREELPNLKEAWAWAHVQSSDALADGVSAALAERPERFIARLICPRKLKHDTHYHACIVPAFAAGVAAGLGQPVDHDDVSLAWDSDPETGDITVELPVYHRWSFATGAAGDFEALVRRLQPQPLGADVGQRDLDVADPGSGLPQSPGELLSFRGALISPAATRRRWTDPSQRDALEHELRNRLNETLQDDGSDPADYDPLEHDPVIGPPAYGSLPASIDAIPERRGSPTWLWQANLVANHRVVAGIGARVVQRNQESLMASAWEQARGLRAINRLLRWTRLAAEVGTIVHAKKVAPMDDGALVQFSKAAHGRIGGTGASRTIAGKLSASAAPRGLVTATMRRVARPEGPVGRALATSAPTLDVASSLCVRFSEDPKGMTQYADFIEPYGLQTGTSAFSEGLTALSSGAPLPTDTTARMRAVLPTTGPAARRFDRSKPVEFMLGQRVSMLQPNGSLPVRTVSASATTTHAASDFDVVGLAAEVRTGLDPRPVLARKLEARITAPDEAWTSDLPGRMRASPEFPEPLYELLVNWQAEYMMPGAKSLANDSIGLAEVNSAFVEAFLLGANHELARELLWREYPADLAATWLRTFWDAVGGAIEDIDPIASWGAGALSKHQVGAASGGALLVLMIRGELLRRYPDTRVTAVKGVWISNERVEDESREEVEPVFAGRLGPDVFFFGFPLLDAEVRGNPDPSLADAGWFFVFEEPPLGPRFGFDVADEQQPGQTPQYWKDLGWGHHVQSIEELAGLAHVPVAGPLDGLTLAYDQDRGDLTWGANAAAMASITLQRPVRMLVHASSMLPSEDE